MGKIIGNIEIGAKIREYRQQAKQVQKYERGVTKVNLVRLQQLSDVLKVPISSFFDDSSCHAYQLSAEEKKLIAYSGEVGRRAGNHFPARRLGRSKPQAIETVSLILLPACPARCIDLGTGLFPP